VAIDGNMRLRRSIINFDRRVHGIPEDKEQEKWLDYMSMFFTVYFAFELLLRALAEGTKLYCGEEAHWNIFDTLLVICSCLSFLSSEGMNVSFVRLLRLLRLSRALRTVRVLKYFQETRIMLSAVLNSIRPLMWSFVFVLLVMFLFGVFLMTAVEDLVDVFMVSEVGSERVQLVHKYMHNFEMIMLTMFMAVSGGVDWGDVFTVLFDHSWWHGIVFVF
jgi:hypothetical protein